jgi:hypothetical protein
LLRRALCTRSYARARKLRDALRVEKNEFVPVMRGAAGVTRLGENIRVLRIATIVV